MANRNRKMSNKFRSAGFTEPTSNPARIIDFHSGHAQGSESVQKRAKREPVGDRLPRVAGGPDQVSFSQKAAKRSIPFSRFSIEVA